MNADPSGYVLETVFDLVSICQSTYDLVKNPSLRNTAYLEWDIGATVVPVLPGSCVTKISKFSKIK